MAAKVAKRALCIGINDYPIPGGDLRGCVNDAKAWADLLRRRFGFAQSNIKMLLDADATKAKILDGIRGLLAGARAGDVLVLTNSSHGSYQAEVGGDEPTYDEVLCPYDIKQNTIVDDELYGLFRNLPDGVRLTVILDNCHSGSGTRLAGDDQRTERFLIPEKWGQRSLEDEDLVRAKSKKTKQGTPRPQSAMKEVLLAGCKDIEVSWDAQMEGTFHGAMTHSAIRAIEEADGRLTYTELGKRVAQKVAAAGFRQTPQLEGSDENKARLIFT